jgi:hypothetical protein
MEALMGVAPWKNQLFFSYNWMEQSNIFTELTHTNQQWTLTISLSLGVGGNPLKLKRSISGLSLSLSLSSRLWLANAVPNAPSHWPSAQQSPVRVLLSRHAAVGGTAAPRERPHAGLLVNFVLWKAGKMGARLRGNSFLFPESFPVLEKRHF